MSFLVAKSFSIASENKKIVERLMEANQPLDKELSEFSEVVYEAITGLTEEEPQTAE